MFSEVSLLFFSEYPAHNPFLSSGRGKPLEKRFRFSRRGFPEVFFLYGTGVSSVPPGMSS